MRSSRIPPRPLAGLALLTLLALPGARALAQDETEVPESEHPASDSPESVTAAQLRLAQGRKRAQAFLIPLDNKSRNATVRVAQALERALAAAKQYEVVDLARSLASDAEPAQEQKAAEGRRLLAEANQSFAVHAYAEAVTKYKAAIKGLAAGLAALDNRDIADAYLRLAAAQQLSGEMKEVKASRDSYLTCALLDPQQKLQATSVDPVAEQSLLLARNDVEQIPIGKLELETRPAGARVFIDGQPQGTTPTRVELAGGKHVLRLERTGFYPTAELLDVASRRETLYSVTLSATPGAASLNQIIAGAADEASHGHPGEHTQELAGKFHLDRVLIGSVSSHGIKVSLLLALADPKSGALLGRQEMLLTADGTDADQLEFDAQEAARKLFALDSNSAADPSATAAPAPAFAPTAQAAPTAAGGDHRPVMPGSAPPALPPPPPEAAPTADDPGLVGKERHVAAPGSAPAFSPEPAPVEPAHSAQASSGDAAPADPQPAKKDEKKKKKKKDLHSKDGTEGWNTN